MAQPFDGNQFPDHEYQTGPIPPVGNSLTQPVPGLPLYPPPAAGAPNFFEPQAVTPSADGAELWHRKYKRERTARRVFVGTTVAAGVAAVGMGIWGLTANLNDSPVSVAGLLGSGLQAPDSSTGSGNGRGGAPGSGAPEGGGVAGGIGSMLGNLFNSDGSLNSDALDQLKGSAQGGSGQLDRIVGLAESSGIITSDQAKQLRDALSSSTGSGSTGSGASDGGGGIGDLLDGNSDDSTGGYYDGSTAGGSIGGGNQDQQAAPTKSHTRTGGSA